MQAALRPYVTAGIALVGASLIAVTPVAPSLPGLSVEQPAIRLLASSIANIPVNLAIAAANIPYYESLALHEYAYALGPAGSTGGVPGFIPPGATVANGGVDPTTGQYTKGGTGSWWTESTDGNTWGWDNGNWPQLAAIGQAVFPFQTALPIAQQLQTFAQAEFIAGERVNCEFECADVLGYLGGWLMFQTPLTSLLSGTNFPDTTNAIDPVTGLPIKPVWANQPGAQLNPLGLLSVLGASLTQDPSEHPVMLPNLGGVSSDLVNVGVDYFNDYNPTATGSFLYWGAPTLWSAPALLAGLVQNFTGIPNQFVGIGAWTNAGGIPLGGSTAGPASLLTGVPAGFAYLAQGLLGYLNPGTYLGPNGVSLGNTLLRNYAWGSLPGSDIVSQLLGIGAASALTPGSSLLGTGSAGLSATGLSSLLSDLGGGSLSTLVNSLSGPASGGSSVTTNATVKPADLPSTLTPSSGQSLPMTSDVVQTPAPDTQVDLPDGTPAPPKVTTSALTDGTNAEVNGTNAPDKGKGGNSNGVTSGKGNNATSNDNQVGPGQSFGDRINSAVSKALGGLNGGAPKVSSSQNSGSSSPNK